MDDIVATLTEGGIYATQAFPVSEITSPPVLTHQRDLFRRAESVDSATCGWVNGDYDDALVCAGDYHQPCLWNSDLHVVGCCAASASTACDWKTSCVPYSSINYGCDSNCQKNTYNLLCPSDRPLCAKATFAGPSGYNYLSCTDQDATTETVYLTWQGGDATVQDLPRYYASYWSSTTTKSTSKTTKTGATATSTKAPSQVVSWLDKHKWPVVGAVAGVLIVVILLLVGCCCYMRRKRTNAAVRGVYVVAPQQEAVPLTSQEAYQPYQRQLYSNS